LLSTGEAFGTKVDNFYPNYSDTSFPSGLQSYITNYRQLVYDSSIPNSIVISGVYPLNSNTLIPNNSGVIIDYQNGQILTTGNYSTPFSGAFSYKEFNTYITSELNHQLIFEQVMDNDINVDNIPTGLPSNFFAAPCSVISFSDSNNEPFTFGGQDLTMVNANVMVICKDQYQIDGIMSLFRDTNNLMFPLIPMDHMPLDFYGNIKPNLSGNYNYNQYIQQFGYPSNLAWVKKVHASKVSEQVNNVNNYFVGFLEFDINIHRYSRLNQ